MAMFTTMTDLVWEADVHLIHVDPHFWVFYNTTQMMMNMLMMMMNMLMMTMLMVMFFKAINFIIIAEIILIDIHLVRRSSTLLGILQQMGLYQT